MVGLPHEDALRFSFLLATPIIAAAAALKLPMLLASRNAPAIEAAAIGASLRGNRLILVRKVPDQLFQNANANPVRCILLTRWIRKHSVVARSLTAPGARLRSMNLVGESAFYYKASWSRGSVVRVRERPIFNLRGFDYE